MKIMPKFYPANDDTVDAYQKGDISPALLNEAAAIWEREWERQGSTDEGSCCGGKGIQVWFAAPRKRSAELTTVVRSPSVQGNLSASRSVGPALAFLKHRGVDAEYYDGWMN